MTREFVSVQKDNLEWESWSREDIPTRGSVQWKTLISGDRTNTDALTCGIAQISPGNSLHLHRHAQAEFYYVLRGVGTMEIDGKAQEIPEGSAVFIPGGASHGITNRGSEDLEFLYGFPTDSFKDVIYLFGEAGAS